MSPQVRELMIKAMILKICLLSCFVCSCATTQHQKTRRTKSTHNFVPNQIENPDQKVLPDSFAIEFKKFCQQRPIRIDEVVDKYGKSKLLKLANEIAESMTKYQSEDILTRPPEPIDVYILVGCGKTDGTAIVDANERVYVFFDVQTLLNQGRDKNTPRSFYIHEYIHGVHIAINQEFAMKNRRTPEEQLVKALIYEGLATYLTEQSADIKKRELFWLNILNPSDFQKWQNNVVAQKPVFSKRIRSFLKNPKSEESLINDLFAVFEMKDLVEKRAAYYYGYEIVDKFFAERSSKDLSFTYEQIRPYVLDYFGIHSVD